MIKKILVLCALLFSANCLAASPAKLLTAAPPHPNVCPQAAPTSSPGFCASFQAVANCHCTEQGLPPEVCQDLSQLYDYMISFFGSLDKACEYQQDTDKQTCINDWVCYLNGGTDSHGALCSATGAAC